MDKSILIMGNGEIIKNSGLGDKIDEFDEVIRINEWKTSGGFEQDAGTKTTIWVVYNPLKSSTDFINGYLNMGYDINQMRDIIKDIREIWYICWKEENILYSWKQNRTIKQLKIYDRCKRHQSLEASANVGKIIYPPTTGFNLIITCLSMYDKIYLAGFDFAGTLNNNLTKLHYWGNKTLESQLKYDVHKPKLECEYVKSLVSQNKIEFLTKDTIIQKSKFIGAKSEGILCPICNNINHLYSWEQRICNWCENNL